MVVVVKILMTMFRMVVVIMVMATTCLAREQPSEERRLSSRVPAMVTYLGGHIPSLHFKP